MGKTFTVDLVLHFKVSAASSQFSQMFQRGYQESTELQLYWGNNFTMSYPYSYRQHWFYLQITGCTPVQKKHVYSQVSVFFFFFAQSGEFTKIYSQIQRHRLNSKAGNKIIANSHFPKLQTVGTISNTKNTKMYQDTRVYHA